DGNLLMARKRIGTAGEDLGFVGDITEVNRDLLSKLMESAVPVIASVATDGHGQSYNVNADLAAAAVAAAVEAAKFVLLTDVAGAGGIACIPIGHSHPAWVDAVQRQAATLTHVSNLWSTEPQERLAERLVGIVGFGRVFLSNSGAEANEAALKIARRHGRPKG